MNYVINLSNYRKFSLLISIKLITSKINIKVVFQMNLLNKCLSLSLVLLLSGCGSSTNAIIPMDNAAPISVNSKSDTSVRNTHYKLIEIIGIGDVYQKKLNDIDIKYADQLLTAAANRNDRNKLATKLGISSKLLLTWVNHIDIMRITGIGPKQSAWLEEAGVDSIPELAQRVAQNLHAKLEVANKKNFVDRMVSVETVQKWIDTAKSIEQIVTE